MDGILIVAILTLVRLVVPIAVLLIVGTLIGRRMSARSH
jgi:hypothetical protein